MHGVGHAVVGVVGVEFLRLVLHEQRVSALVQGAEDVGDKVVLVVVGGDAHVLRAVAVGEGVLGGHQHQRALPQALQPQKIAGEGLLLGDRHGSGEEVLPDGLALGDDALHQRHDARLQCGEERVQLFLAATLLIVVQAGVVVGGGLLVPQVDGPAGVVDHRGEAVPEEGEVACLLGAQPRAVGLVAGGVQLEGERRREVLGAHVVLPQALDEPALHVRQALAVLVELVHQALVLLGVGQLVQLPSEHGDVLPGLFQALLRGAAHHVEVELAHAALIDLGFAEDGIELLEFLLVGHGFTSGNVSFGI